MRRIELFKKKLATLRDSILFLEDFAIELKVENKDLLEGEKKKHKVFEDGSRWMMKLLKAFSVGALENLFNPIQFLKMWMSHFINDSLPDFQVKLLKEVVDQSHFSIQEAIKIDPEEMATVLDRTGMSLCCYKILENKVREILARKGLEDLTPLPLMHKVKGAIQQTQKLIPSLFEFDDPPKRTNRQKKLMGIACCQLASVVEWICFALTGVSDIGKAVTWKVHANGRSFCKGVNQVVLSVQPIGLPLWHFNEGQTKGESDPVKNKQWAKESSYLVFPFLIFQEGEKKYTFQEAIPNHVFSDMIHLEHDGLHFMPSQSPNEENIYRRGTLPGCEEGSVKWCSGVLFELSSPLPEWISSHSSLEQNSINLNNGCGGGGRSKWRGGKGKA